MTGKMSHPSDSSPGVGSSSRIWLVVGAAALGVMLVCGLVAIIGAVVFLGGPNREAVTDRGTTGEDQSAGDAPGEIVRVPDPASAALRDVRGIVEIQAADGSWSLAEAGDIVGVGQRVRTGALSSVTLAFYDGSLARLQASTEVSIDALEAKRAGARIVLLTQIRGETQHEVAPSTDPGSRYEVTTSSGTATAHGTIFTVVMAVDQRLIVYADEGSVAVTNLNVTVVIVAGQSTMVWPGQTPGDPLYVVSGQGEVTQMGGTWIIGGQTFLVDSATAVSGNPQIGDTVAVRGRLLSGGGFYADVIVLVHHAPENSFSLTGVLDSIGGGSAVISGATILTDASTAIQAGLEPGDTVSASGIILDDGSLLAEQISLVETAPGQPFSFTGVVASTGGTWVISGVELTTDENTAIGADLAVGDLVEVSGWILDDGTWLAASISQADEDEREFHLSGPVDSIAPWSVAGVAFETDSETEIDDEIQTGDMVAVEGVILDDGTWLASEIGLIEDDDEPGPHFQFIGVVTSASPLVVTGPAFTTDEDTRIDGGIEVGDAVMVSGIILPDGAWLATDIERLEDDDDPWLGCTDFSAVVVSSTSTQVILLNGQTIELDDDTEIEGNVAVASVVIVHMCTAEDGTVTIIQIIVIYQMDTLPVSGPDGEDEDHDEDEDEDEHEEEDDD